MPDANISWWTAASVADAAAVNPNGFKMLFVNCFNAFFINDIKTHSDNGFNLFFIKDNPVFSNGPKSLPKNSPDFPILYNWVFDNLISDDEPFAKACNLCID